MESFNLKTASTYINNLLLARGLLRNGKAIEFARPSKGEGGTEATMAQIINLVHDMILRRDVGFKQLPIYKAKGKANCIHSASKSSEKPLPKPCAISEPKLHQLPKLSKDSRRVMTMP